MRELARWSALLAVMSGACAGVTVSSGTTDGSSVETDGGSAAPGDGGAAIPVPTSKFKVMFSEVMYHPIVDDEPEPTYEFVEIHNTMKTAVALDGWTMAGEVQYVFPAGTSIEPDGYLVIARNRQKLAPVYKLDPAKVLGDYMGDLANGGGVLQLIDATGAVADAFKYDDKFPWPLGADALGAGEKWFVAPDPRADFSPHRYLGVSLERRRFDVAATDVGNWSPSKLDGATPGAWNGTAGAQKPVVETLTAVRKQGDWPIRGGDDVVIHARLSPMWSKTTGLALEYFVDDVEKIGEPIKSVAMDADGDGFSATLPATMNAENAIVRYRIKADTDAGNEVVSPRPFTTAIAGDPITWHAYFVHSAKVVTDIGKSKLVYQLFISSAAWGKMWIDTGGKAADKGIVSSRRTTDATDTADSGCIVRADYFMDEPAIFVKDGIVHDVLVRYQGSQFNRLNGEQLAAWPAEYHGPDKGPSPPLLLSWQVTLPKHNPLSTDFAGKRTSVNVKKAKFWSCQAFPNLIENKMMESVGLSSARVKFLRMYINGGYYGYMVDQGPVDDIVAQRADPDGKVVGDLFKANGTYNGPGRTTDFAPLATNRFCSGAADSYPQCGPMEVSDPAGCAAQPAKGCCSTRSNGWPNEPWYIYQTNYERQTNAWKEVALNEGGKHLQDDAQKLIDGLEAARKADCPTAVEPKLSCPEAKNRRQFLMDNFDVDKLRDYIALRNWAGGNDDNHHNYNIYKKASDGKWLIIGWDFEEEYGGLRAIPGLGGRVVNPAELMSFYTGEEGLTFEQTAQSHWSRIKDAYLKSFRKEYHARLLELSGVGKKCPGAPEPAGAVPGECLFKPTNLRTDPPNIRNAIDDMIAEFDQADWDETAIKPSDPLRYPYSYQCRPQDYFDGMKKWIQDRYNAVLTKIPRQ